MDIKIYKDKAELAQSSEYSRIRKYQLDEIVSVSSSNIDPLELKGMLRLIKRTDEWEQDYEIELKKNR